MVTRAAGRAIGIHESGCIDGPALLATMRYPRGICLGPAGLLYFSQTTAVRCFDRSRGISPCCACETVCASCKALMSTLSCCCAFAGTVTTVAGCDQAGFNDG